MPYEKPATTKRCEMHGFGPCSGKISGEHYISAGLLRELSSDGKIIVQGLPWATEPKRVGIASLTANILCQGHNSRLSDLDEIALKFFRAIKAAQLSLQAHNTTGSFHAFNGRLLERWFIKVLFATWASGNLADGGERIEGRPPSTWIEYILGLRALPSQWGLYMKPTQGFFSTVENEFELVPLSGSDGSGLKGAHFKIARLPFTLVMGKPGGDWGIQRPAKLRLEQDNVGHDLRMGWAGARAGPSVTYTRIADSSDHLSRSSLDEEPTC